MGTITVTSDFERAFGMTKREYFGKKYLTFEMLEDQSISIDWSAEFVDADNPNIITVLSYSLDDGQTWTDIDIDDAENYTIENLKKGDKVLFKGDGGTHNADFEQYLQITPDAMFDAYGNIMSLIYGDDFENKNFDTEKSQSFAYLFNGLDMMTDAANIVLPSNTVEYCYYNMFNGCAAMTTAPELVADELAISSYQSMFLGCRKLNSITMLATDINAEHCLTDWVKNVAETGTLTVSSDFEGERSDINIPDGWLVVNHTDEGMNLQITANGEYNVSNFASVDVNMALPEGNITITENGTDIDIADYATATVNVQAAAGLVESITAEEWDTFANKTYYTGAICIKSATIPNTVTEIGQGAFDGAALLSSLTFEDLNKITTIGNNSFRYTSLTSFVYPSSVTTVGNAMFQECRNLASVSLPNGVTAIYNQAFNNCSALTTINVPTALKTISNSVFANCSSLTSFPLENTDLRTIGNNAFQNTHISSVTFPSTVTSIGEAAFSGCGLLTSVTFNTNSITTISRQCFYGCYSLPSITIPNGVTIIHQQAFYNCSALASVSLPNGVTTIYNQAFYNCSALTTIDLPSTVTNMAAMALGSIGTVICRATTPPTIATNTISPMASIYVPDDYVTAYQGATNWSAYSSKIHPMSDLPTT